jgi:hypothetical protein
MLYFCFRMKMGSREGGTKQGYQPSPDLSALLVQSPSSPYNTGNMVITQLRLTGGLNLETRKEGNHRPQPNSGVRGEMTSCFLNSFSSRPHDLMYLSVDRRIFWVFELHLFTL